MSHRIRSLRASLIEVERAWNLDVKYKVTIDNWTERDRFTLRSFLLDNNDKPAKDVDGRTIEHVIDINDPYDVDSGSSNFKRTFRARLSRESTTIERGMRLRTTLHDSDGTQVDEKDDRRIRLRKLDSDYTTQELKDTQLPLVVILPGILGADSAQRDIVELLEGRRGRGGIGVAAQIWDWTEDANMIGVGLSDRVRVSMSTEATSEAFASRVGEWKDGHPDQPLYLLCGSGGASISLLCAKYLPGRQMFKRVVWASGAVALSRKLDELSQRTEEGLYNYYSYRDYTLVGIVTAFMMSFKFQLGWTAAGRFGYRPGNPNWDMPIKQLGWNETIREDNDGSHLDCYDEKFFAKYFAPLFAGKPPSDDPDKWQKEVLPSYEQPDAAAE